MPDRLPSLIVLVGFWVPPALAGWVAAGSLEWPKGGAVMKTYATFALFMLAYAAGWFLFNLRRMPPYIPGATTDPTFAPPNAILWLAIVTGVLVLPGSLLAFVLAFRRKCRIRTRPRTSDGAE